MIRKQLEDLDEASQRLMEDRATGFKKVKNWPDNDRSGRQAERELKNAQLRN